MASSRFDGSRDEERGTGRIMAAASIILTRWSMLSKAPPRGIIPKTAKRRKIHYRL
jgi:hypothetical protein